MIRRTVCGERTLERSQSFQGSSIELVVWRFVCAMLAILILKCMGTVSAHAATPPLTQSSVDSTNRAHVAANYGQVPLSFEPNQGQSDVNVQFLSRGSGYSLYLTPGEAVLSLQRKNPAEIPASGSRDATPTVDVLRMQLVGASATAAATGLDPQPGVTNYFIGNDPKKWHTGIPTYGKVNYAGVYPGIDLVFYGSQRQLEYDFVVKPGGDSSRIAWSFRGAQPHLGKDGSLELNPSVGTPGGAPGGPVRFLAPVAYQVLDGRRRPVAVSYAVGDQTVRFALGPYDHSQALIIDPILSYFSYLGGTGNDYIGNANPGATGSAGPEPTQAVGIDAQDNLYVGGSTTSTDFPVVAPVLLKTTKTNTSETWAFVSKFSPDGSKLLYSTYIGGSTGGNDAVYALAVDATGNVYATGTAGTNDFPVTAGAFQTLCAPHRDNNTGNAVAICTFNTGNGNYSQNAFALKLNPTGSSLVYSSFLGGFGATWGTGIAIDGAGQAYLTGTATATLCGGDVYQYGAQYECFPTTANAAMSDIGGGNSIDMAFMTVFNATGTGLVYSTLYGDTQGTVSVAGAGCTTDCGAGTYGMAIALDPSGNIYIGGRTITSHLLLTTGAFNTTGSGPNPGNPNAVSASNGLGYVAKFSALTSSGTALVYSTYFGGGQGVGGGGDVGGLAADAAGNAYIAGETHAPDFPATAGAFQTQCDVNEPATFCNQDGYVAKLNPTGTAIVWATYLGNGSNAPLYFLGPTKLDSAGNVYVLGEGNGQLPLGGGASSTLNGNPTAYVAKFNSTGSQVLFGAAVAGPGNGSENAGGMAVDSAGAVYVGGTMGSGGTYAGTTGAFQPAFAGGGFDAFVAKVLPSLPSTTALSLSATTATVGQQVTLTAKVTGPSGSTAVPTGTVTFLSGSSTLGTGTLDSTGTATYSSSSFTATTFTLTASYAGDGTYSASTSTVQTLVVSPDATTTTLTVSPTAATTGQAVTFTAKVKVNTGTAVPTGTITFLNGTKQLAAVAVDGTGTSTYTSSTLAVGSYSVTAAYSGDANNASSTSGATALVISTPGVATATALTASATTITTGASVTLTATVSPVAGSVIPTGTVTFKDGSNTLGTGTLDATGKTTYTTATLSVGSHSITGAYGGDAGNLISTSPALTITVNAAPAADFTLSLAPVSGTVTGNTASGAIAVTVTPVNGFHAATTFACSGLPANSTCTFNPTTVTPNGTAAATTTLTITGNVKAALALAGSFFAFLMIPIGGWRSRRPRRFLFVLIPMLLLLFAIGVSGCGKGTGGGTTTPKGTYSVTVIATSGTLNHSATYSLTVQ
ncbi:MAG TPA: Ig-like domain repeat protein [Steroidobacteraceae bacterium]